MSSKFTSLFSILIAIGFYTGSVFAQADTSVYNRTTKADSALNNTLVKEQTYTGKDGRVFIYPKTRPFEFITNLPADAGGIVVTSFKRENIKPLFIITGSTLAFMIADQSVTDGLGKFFKHVNISADEKYKDVWNIKSGKTNISLIKAPQNINTALYQMGQGFPSLLIGAGLFAFGKIHHDYRAVSTASQLAETFILMGVSTQLLKRLTGRQSPSNATGGGGEWHFLPSFKNFQNNTPNYDAFPSGHLATLMSTVTVLADNYPDKRYIKPVGYTLTGLVGVAMINNKVHWLSDYPLAIALGYVCAKQVVKRNRRTINSTNVKKNKAQLSYAINYCYGKFLPELIYTF